MKNFSLLKMACVVSVVCAAMTITSPAQTLTTLYSFTNGITDGNGPSGRLVQATDGNFYGVTANNGGTFFKITPTGTLTTLYKFAGGGPLVGLVQGTDGNFYGTTQDNNQWIYKITSADVLIPLHSFWPQIRVPIGLVQATDGNFYGTTLFGGTNGSGASGSVFKITPKGAYTTLHNFTGSDGGNPFAVLIQATDGNLYGTTEYGGSGPCTNQGYANGCGTVFKITPKGVLASLYSFTDRTDGAYPRTKLVQATNGNFYGTTNGSYNYGTIFKITSAGVLTTLHNFSGPDGDGPTGLVRATDGNFYGTTELGGNYNRGTIFKITSAGTLTTLHNFAGSPDGDVPNDLIQATDGNFYGTTGIGGTYDFGTVFQLSVGLGPFVITNPTSGRVGSTVTILGNNLTGTTGVSFNGTPATFTAVSDSEIQAVVPALTTTWATVTVVTPQGTLQSNVAFGVAPQITDVTPTSGPVGTVVTITGARLAQTLQVMFGNVAATKFNNTNTRLFATVPAGATTGRITLTTPGGTAIGSIFTVTP